MKRSHWWWPLLMAMLCHLFVGRLHDGAINSGIANIGLKQHCILDAVSFHTVALATDKHSKSTKYKPLLEQGASAPTSAITTADCRTEQRQFRLNAFASQLPLWLQYRELLL